jgi:DNA processing protein
MQMEPKAYWVGFNLVKGIGAVRIQALLDFFGNLEIAWNAPPEAFLNAGFSQKIVENLVIARRTVDLEKMMERLERLHITVLTWADEGYPRRLKEVNQSPPVLYLRGSILPEDSWAVAVVGTRRITIYGRQIAEEIGTYLAQNGITIVSGLARGVDAVVHEAALKAGGRTVAVLGCGVDRIYPPENQKMAERMISQGALVSDYPLGTPPEAINFPPRNRIISGLSLATVVVEAGETSGALITATFAAEQGREVLAVPGNIHSPQSKGTNRLLAQGARPLLEMGDVLDAIKLEKAQTYRQAQIALPQDAAESAILNLLGMEPLHIDDIQSQAGLSIEKVSATLTVMELKGMVRQVGGMNYVAIRETGSQYRIDPDD